MSRYLTKRLSTPPTPLHYYNDVDPDCCQWLYNLMTARPFPLIPYGQIDDRSIRRIRARDLVNSDGTHKYVQCHFFAGIAGWPEALRIARWPVSRPVWTGSCPCQPFSQAGKRQGAADSRHLWPAWFYLIDQCRPQCVFGEQVSSAIGHGWLDGISADLEGAGYACGAVVLGAHSVGAPHIRQRLWWVAHAYGGADERVAIPASRNAQVANIQRSREHGREQEDGGVSSTGDDSSGDHSDNRLALNLSPRLEERAIEPARDQCSPIERGGNVDGAIPIRLGEPQYTERRTEQQEDGHAYRRDGSGRPSRADKSPNRLAISECGRLEGQEVSIRQVRQDQASFIERGATHWSDSILIPCLDGKHRRIPNPATQPGLQPLASRLPNRMARLRGAGNSIVPHVAAIFISSYLDILGPEE